MPIPTSSAPAKRARSKGDKRARKVEVAAQSVAGGIGSAFGAAKIRDEYRREHPEAFRRQTMRAGQAAVRRGVPPAKAARAVRIARTSKPGLKPLLGVVAAGSVATGAHRYQEIHHYLSTKKDAVHKSEPHRAPSAPVRIRVTPPPRHAARPYVGKRRVLTPVDKLKVKSVIHSQRLFNAVEAGTDLLKAASCPQGPFHQDETTRTVREPGMAMSAFGVEHIIEKGELARAARRPSTQNTRSQNAKVGGAVTGGAFGALGAHAGGRVGRHRTEFDRGAAKLGVGMSRARAAGRTAGAIARDGATVGGALGAAGAVTGAALGASLAHKKKRRAPVAKSAFGVEHLVEKANHRRGESSVTATYDSGKVPIHTLGRKDRITNAGTPRPISIGNQRTPGRMHPQPAARMGGKGKAAVGLGAAAAAGGVTVAARRRRSGQQIEVGKSGHDAFLAKDDSTPKPNAAPSGKRRLAAAAGMGIHPIVAAKPGKKLGAFGSTVGHTYAGAALGGVAGAATRNPRLAVLGSVAGAEGGIQRAVTTSSRKGRYKPEPTS